ncbi:ABC transporter permease [Bailinhaonella thermotolerans]|uniref:ABC transporter permease n=1 Tax=Bailinhaonella thermotolerans TaxID=1070861 RepID=A0A3A4B778_9ACTN|nr:ABC transporter permease [Bailinhaonella thermotolerans]RJL34427.1 ABC transporter permease [Bailinhaonella thermotolerans]
MLKFLLRRLANYVLLVVIATSLAYLLAASTLDPRANYEGRSPRPPEAVVDARLSELNLNDKVPLIQRFGTWAGDVVTGDFGRTWEGNSVNQEITRRVGVTLRLLVLGVLLGSVLGVFAGAYAAVKQYGWFDHGATLVSFLILSIPTVVIAVLLQIAAVAFNEATGTRFFQYTGEYTPGLQGGLLTHLGDRLQHLVLPTLTLALSQIAVYSRYQRNMMLDVMNADFVRTARAKGLTRRAALVRHALRTALIPAVTYFAFTFGALLVGTTFTEKIYGWHGMGELLVNSIYSNDVNSVAAVSCFAAVAVLIAALLSDVLHAALDPRVRVG